MIATGGILGAESGSFVGSKAVRTITRYNVDVALFSCKALSMSGA